MCIPNGTLDDKRLTGLKNDLTSQLNVSTITCWHDTHLRANEWANNQCRILAYIIEGAKLEGRHGEELGEEEAAMCGKTGSEKVMYWCQPRFDRKAGTVERGASDLSVDPLAA